MNNLDKTLDLLKNSYSPFHVVDNLKQELIKAGFIELKETESYDLVSGKSYFVTRNDSSLIAFKLPSKITSVSFLISATHTDSPTFKVKPNPVIRFNNLLSLNVEPYGGMINSSWMDRPLSIAGRILYRSDDVLRIKLINIDKDLLQIPNVCIHMNREVNSGYKFDASKDMIPLLGTITDKEFDFFEFLKKEADLNSDDEILSHDLFLYNRDKPRLVGLNQEFISSPKLDDLMSTYSALLGFLETKIDDADVIPLYAAFDNEEVGSLTRQGANSTFLKDTLTRITRNLNADYEASIASSFLLSIDNAHADHPNHPEYTDKTTKIELNKGVVIKYNANQSYTSDAYSSAIVKSLLKDLNLNYQEFTNRSDLRGGSTLGNLSNSEVSLISCDIGLPQLAMHSANELAGSHDIDDLVKLTSYYFSHKVKVVD